MQVKDPFWHARLVRFQNAVRLTLERERRKPLPRSFRQVLLDDFSGPAVRAAIRRADMDEVPKAASDQMSAPDLVRWRGQGHVPAGIAVRWKVIRGTQTTLAVTYPFPVPY